MTATSVDHGREQPRRLSPNEPRDLGGDGARLGALASAAGRGFSPGARVADRGARAATGRHRARAWAGTGDTGFAAAALLGERGRLISTDFSPEMVEVARRRGAELGLENVDYRVIDARANRARGRLHRRSALPERVHADGRPRRRAVRDAPGAPPRRAPGAVRMGRSRAATRGPRSAAGSSSSAATFRHGARRARGLQHGERRTHAHAPGGRQASPRCAPTRYRSASPSTTSTPTRDG